MHSPSVIDIKNNIKWFCRNRKLFFLSIFLLLRLIRTFSFSNIFIYRPFSFFDHFRFFDHFQFDHFLLRNNYVWREEWAKIASRWFWRCFRFWFGFDQNVEIRLNVRDNWIEASIHFGFKIHLGTWPTATIMLLKWRVFIFFILNKYFLYISAQAFICNFLKVFFFTFAALLSS